MRATLALNGLTSKEGINGIFLLYNNRFNIDQYVLGAVLGSLSLLVIHSMQSFLTFNISLCNIQLLLVIFLGPYFFGHVYNKI